MEPILSAIATRAPETSIKVFSFDETRCENKINANS